MAGATQDTLNNVVKRGAVCKRPLSAAGTRDFKLVSRIHASAARFGPASRAVIHVTLTSTVSEPHTVQRVPKRKADAKHGGS